MIDPDMLGKAIRVVQQVMIVGRQMAYDKAPHDRIAALLDNGEYLSGLLLESTEQTTAFRDYLASIARDFPETQWILDEYCR